MVFVKVLSFCYVLLALGLVGDHQAARLNSQRILAETDLVSQASAHSSDEHVSAADRPDKESPCRPFYDDLQESVQHYTSWHRTYNLNARWHLPVMLLKGLVHGLWTDTLDMDTLGRWAFWIFLSSGQNGAIPVFWAGFAHSLGTRKILDDFITHMKGCGSATNWTSDAWGRTYGQRCEDIEHGSHEVGRALRHLHWARHCHKTKHDSKFWLSLSKVFAMYSKLFAHEAEALAIGSEYVRPFYKPAGKVPRRAVMIAINYPLHRLPQTFLFEHELALLQGFHIIRVFDFKNSCSEKLFQLVVKSTDVPASTLECHYPGNDESMQRFADDISNLESCTSQGIEFVSANPSTLTATSATDCCHQCEQTQGCARYTYRPITTLCELIDRSQDWNFKHVAATDAISGRPHCQESVQHFPSPVPDQERKTWSWANGEQDTFSAAQLGHQSIDAVAARHAMEICSDAGFGYSEEYDKDHYHTSDRKFDWLCKIKTKPRLRFGYACTTLTDDEGKRFCRACAITSWFPKDILSWAKSKLITPLVGFCP